MDIQKTWRDYMPDYVCLYYINYNDDLEGRHKEINSCISSNNWEALDEMIFDCWDFPEEYYLEDIKKNMVADGMESEYDEHYDEIRDWLYEHDKSTPIDDLLRNSKPINVYYDLGYEVDGWHDQYWGPSYRGTSVKMEVHRICQKLGFKKGSPEAEKITTMVNQASYGGYLRIYFEADLNQLINCKSDDYKSIRFKGNFAVAIIDPTGGSGDFEYFNLDKVFPFIRSNLIVSDMDHYSLESIFGMCSDWLKDVHHPEMLYTKSKAKIDKSPSALKIAQDEDYIKTFKSGGCTLGDTDITRHRDVYYDNNFPCGHHCPHCGQFWID